MELNRGHNCRVNVLSKSDNVDEKFQTGVLDVVEDISLMVIDKNVENIVKKTSKRGADFLQLFCLEELY